MSLSIHEIIAAYPRKPYSLPVNMITCPICSMEFTPSLRRRKYCSRACSGRAFRLAGQARAAKAAGDKRRGSNPDRHIAIRVEGGGKVLLHRKIMAEHLGRELLPYPEEIVHHIDRNKHHNCVPGKILCGNMLCEGNLQLLSGEAAVEHIRLHYEDLHRWRQSPRDPYNFEDNEW